MLSNSEGKLDATKRTVRTDTHPASLAMLREQKRRLTALIEKIEDQILDLRIHYSHLEPAEQTSGQAASSSSAPAAATTERTSNRYEAVLRCHRGQLAD